MSKLVHQTAAAGITGESPKQKKSNKQVPKKVEVYDYEDGASVRKEDGAIISGYPF